MDAAAPLVRAGLLAAGRGRDLTLPGPPDGIERGPVCPLSGLRAGPDCPHQKLEHFAAGHAPGRACDWHRREGGRVVVRYPAEVQPWARRSAERGGRHLAARW